MLNCEFLELFPSSMNELTSLEVDICQEDTIQTLVLSSKVLIFNEGDY